MIVKAIKKQRCRCVAALVCLLMASNSVHGAVLCFGTDGHVQIEPTFHERCNDSAHSQHTEQKQVSNRVNHVENEHCQPCVDVPISIGLIELTRTSKQLSPAFSAPSINAIASAGTFNLSAYDPAPISSNAPPYFVSLCTVVLLV